MLIYLIIICSVGDVKGGAGRDENTFQLGANYSVPVKKAGNLYIGIIFIV